MMKTMSSVISAIAGALIGVTAAHADPVTLRVGYAFPARDGLFRQPIIERFMQQNPDIRIVTEANAADCPALLQQLLRAAVTGDLPDVVASLCYPDMPVLAERGLLVPLDRFLAADPLWAAAGVKPEALAATQWKGKTIALPESVSTSIIYYNIGVIRKVRPSLSNLDLSWDDILSLADNIHTSIPALVPIFFEYYPDSYNWSFHAQWRAADDRNRPRPDVTTAPPGARRAVDGASATGGPGLFPGAEATQPRAESLDPGCGTEFEGRASFFRSCRRP
ncbi:ABC-type glycerol-3-phosphate transport system substrate-binding protein [Bradyrhizobium sp. RT6a]